MRRLVWVVAWACVAAWSLFCAAAYGVFNLVGGWAARNADMFSSDPETVVWIFWIFSWVRDLSTGGVLVGWGVVSLMMLAVPWLLDRIAAGSAVAPAMSGRAADARMGGGGVIDLPPDQYSVGPRPGAGMPERASGPAPRIPGRG